VEIDYLKINIGNLIGRWKIDFVAGILILMDTQPIFQDLEEVSALRKLKARIYQDTNLTGVPTIIHHFHDHLPASFSCSF